MSKFVSHVPEVMATFHANMRRAMEAVALVAEGYAKDYAPKKTGRLQASIGHSSDEHEAIIGTDVEYAPYQEFGTRNMRANPYLRPAAGGHTNEYKEIIKEYLEG